MSAPQSGVSASCFSQWYDAPFVIGAERYPTAEHYMMAEKAALFADDEIRAKVLTGPQSRCREGARPAGSWVRRSPLG